MRVCATFISASLFVVGCSPKPDNRICLKPPTRDVTALQAMSAEAKLDACVHNWAYRLARSTDNAATVADAVLGACEDSLLEETEARLAANPISGLTLNRNLVRIIAEQTRPKALFHVVQARAGHCDLE